MHQKREPGDEPIYVEDDMADDQHTPPPPAPTPSPSPSPSPTPAPAPKELGDD